MKLTWKIGGEAGFGIMTTGLAFSKIASRLGYNLFDYIEYPSLIRGGHNAYETVVSDEEVTAFKSKIDYLVCLNAETYKLHQDRLDPQGFLVYDPDDFTPQDNFKKVLVPFRKIMTELKGQAVMKNTIALASTLALMKIDPVILMLMLEQQFGRKGEDVVNFNKQFAKRGYDHVVTNYASFIEDKLPKRESEEKLVLTGNDAFSLGAVMADCRLYSAYPMTPSSSVLTSLASWQEKTGMVARHAEDEISVINTALGASFAGVRSAVGTSGGGFALMVESISLAGIIETPIVIFLSQRPGPATGLPTWTEQGDLLFAVHAGHGEFPKIVLTPGDVYEMVELTTKAFNLADIYQTPVIVVSDMFLSESHHTLTKKLVTDLKNTYRVDYGKTITNVNGEKYLRYQLTDDGISPRLVPGQKGYFYQANSYEHVEDGHTTEEALPRRQQADKRHKKIVTYLKTHFKPPQVYGDLDKSSTVFVAWGSTKGPILEAQKLMKNKGNDTAFIHFTHVFPLNPETVKPLFSSNKRYVLVENNSQAQFGKLLLAETGIDIKEKLLKYDGRQFTAEEIANFIL